MPTYDASLFNPPAPLAMVTLRNPASGETMDSVPMLIDSGADITVVPESCILRLKLTVEVGLEYEVEGFDGHRSAARSANLHLLIANLTFRGQFLVVPKPYGYLGRNLLNHIRLSLLGPELTWSIVEKSA
jgi:hypothetical protein